MPRVGKYWLFINLYHTPDHTWARVKNDGPVEVGIDDLKNQNQNLITGMVFLFYFN